jgi:hypothetical protein
MIGLFTRNRRNVLRVSAFGVLALVAGCVTRTPEREQMLEKSRSLNAAYVSQDFTCKRTDAANVELAALNANAGQFVEKCVRIKAFSDSTMLYGDAGHMQRPKSGPVLDIVWKDAEIARRLHLGPSFVTVVGRVRSCDERRKLAQAVETYGAANATPAVIPTPPPCRNDGLAIFISEAQIIPTAMD